MADKKETEDIVSDNPTEEIKETTEKETPAEEKKEENHAPKKKKKSEAASEKEIKKLREENDELNDKYLRILAEYDNFRRRTQKEHDALYSQAYGDALAELLPIIDNLERAAGCDDADGIKKGVEMTLNQSKSALEKLGIEEIPAEIGGEFNPEFHNAVMHTEDESLGDNVIAEVFQRGYRRGDRIIRHTMVRVAN